MSVVRQGVKRWLPAPLRAPAKALADAVEQGLGAFSAHRRLGGIAMFHVGRSGSTVLARLLDQHPRVKWDGEIYYNRWEELGTTPESFGSFDPIKYLRRRMLAAGSRYYGFEIKCLPEQHLSIIDCSLSTFVDSISEAGITHFITLKRNNYLRRILSQIIGYRTQVRHIGAQQEAKLNRIRVDFDRIIVGVDNSEKSLMEWFHETDATHRELEALLSTKRVMHLTYEEDILKDPQVACNKVCEFLDVSLSEGLVNLGRTNPFRIDEMVENYDELVRLLAGTQFEWMLEDR